MRADGDEPLSAEHPEIPAEHALQGFDGVRAYSARHPQSSAALLERVLGARPAGDDTWELRGERRGGTIAYDPPPAEPGRQSAGTVHHVAWGTTVAEHPRWLEHLREAGVQSTPIIDRYYFHSIYFREPSGVLFEIADDGPGFTVDGPVEELGLEDHPAAVPRGSRRARDRGAPDAAARSARARVARDVDRGLYDSCVVRLAHEGYEPSPPQHPSVLLGHKERVVVAGDRRRDALLGLHLGLERRLALLDALVVDRRDGGRVAGPGGAERGASNPAGGRG